MAGKQLKTHRQIRWNVNSTPNPQAHNWSVVIINDPRTMRKIQQRLVEKAQPIDELSVRTNGSVPKSHGLQYKLITFNAPYMGPTQMPWGDIYQGPIKKDEGLYERERSDGLEIYVDAQMQRLVA
ncbi:hypothetical protein CMI47_02135 [Candidatus Pacearchaeota archaeon]|nr:hypothetical protein [Candidatus Pacearchaeota archaeon]|tara:strand:- start:5570 stop:5944 length:375 start_codon:yes stop_codon:yes gene_type:complete